MNCYWLLKLMAIPRTNGVKVNIFFGLKATTVKNRGESPNFPPTFYFSSLLGAKKKNERGHAANCSISINRQYQRVSSRHGHRSRVAERRP